ncbi:glycosyltransferase [Clostridium ljungdahlii]|uniref:GalNAc-alpha-(1->4)-GalNAc-alpha-(1->3)-diNAcBac-PP-undecaprenol alpha-1,4-N-acetyl-D-galactosaminyltransferase n=1 Tax=Clostridium ljungdahlii TaxID=1538 RepID=A0A168NVN9_9CLOT|nr:glycosyltransferase [Clostridium ljungdahlii]OAA86970.1 GalNAc-alpha-(1->4)-GalNAc-alpha-(1->3)-diNAcBac-PP-undecaprenol alpha-1,4-N-acetyl-D-galactosaminyltransferase [Clostridium ljungdahlii]
MKKVLFVANKLGGGGAERVLTLVANEMETMGYDVSIVVFHKCSEKYENSCPEIYYSFKNDISQILGLRKIIRAQKPDAVIAFEYFVNMKTILAAVGMGVKVIISERNNPYILRSQPLKYVLRNYLYGFADTLVCQTKDAKAAFPLRVQKKSVVILNPIKDNVPRWNYENANRTIINFCRLEKQKNIPMLIAAFEIVYKKHPDYTLEIYGSGREEEYIKEIVRQKRLEHCVKLLPFCPNIHEIAAKCAMFVSSSDFEGLSNSMLEAMAIGMPVICTDCPIGGARMVINNGKNGLLIPVGNVEKLAEAINKVIENNRFACDLAKESVLISKKLSLQNIVKKWTELI